MGGRVKNGVGGVFIVAGRVQVDVDSKMHLREDEQVRSVHQFLFTH